MCWVHADYGNTVAVLLFACYSVGDLLCEPLDENNEGIRR